MRREVAYDSLNDRLVYVVGAADQEYWTSLWRSALTEANIRRGDRFVASETSRVLPPGAKVVDAGCGIGATVYGLAEAGFDAYGIDFSEATVGEIRTLAPGLKIEVADVRAMPFEGGSLDGVWSLGVIEHFPDGYDALIEEVSRVLRPNGHLFLTVPVISPLKSLRIRFRRYRPLRPEDRSNFFQFAFRKQEVVERINSHGYRLIRSYGRSGSFGLHEDLGSVAKFVLPSPENTALWARAWWRGIDKLVTPICHHTHFFLFQKLN